MAGAAGHRNSGLESEPLPGHWSVC
jgi:hypothetical protein